MSDDRGRPGLESGAVPESPYSVVASMRDLPSARLLVEELEQRGVAPGAIALSGALPGEDDDVQDRMPESEAFGDVTRSTVGGGAIGAVVGGILGGLVTLVFPQLGLFWAILLGAVFGGGIGLAAGGMAVAKYNSPAWRESYESVQEDESVSVGVHSDDKEIVATAEELMHRHEPLEIRRLDGG